MLDETWAGHAFFMTSMTDVSWESKGWTQQEIKQGGKVGGVPHVPCFIMFRRDLRRGLWVSS